MKILIRVVVLAMGVLFTINFSVINNENIPELSLKSLLTVNQAQAEDSESNNVCKEDDCSVTLAFVTYYGHYWHCAFGTGTCGDECFVGCDAL